MQFWQGFQVSDAFAIATAEGLLPLPIAKCRLKKEGISLSENELKKFIEEKHHYFPLNAKAILVPFVNIDKIKAVVASDL